MGSAVLKWPVYTWQTAGIAAPCEKTARMGNCCFSAKMPQETASQGSKKDVFMRKIPVHSLPTLCMERSVVSCNVDSIAWPCGTARTCNTHGISLLCVGAVHCSASSFRGKVLRLQGSAEETGKDKPANVIFHKARTRANLTRQPPPDVRGGVAHQEGLVDGHRWQGQSPTLFPSLPILF